MKTALTVFIDWLKENNYYDKFIYNFTFLNDNYNTLLEFINYIGSSSNYTNESFIAQAFEWNDTEEGDVYWSKASQDWVEYINK